MSATYISRTIKYTMFFFNLIIWLFGLILIAVGVYAVWDKWSAGEPFKLKTIIDILFNIGFLLIIVGGIVFLVSFAGCIGALRENMYLLKFYSFFQLLLFLVEMICLALGFIYPQKLTEFLEGELSEKLIKSYRDDLDFQNLIDLIQSDFGCCGSDGFKDWSMNEYFNCTQDNPSVESCGVPYSCCHPQQLVNLMCGFQVQEKSIQDASVQGIYTRGCVSTIQELIESNLYPIGGIAIGILLSQLLVIWLSRTLEGQIELQTRSPVLPA